MHPIAHEMFHFSVLKHQNNSSWNYTNLWLAHQLHSRYHGVSSPRHPIFSYRHCLISFVLSLPNQLESVSYILGAARILQIWIIRHQKFCQRNFSFIFVFSMVKVTHTENISLHVSSLLIHIYVYIIIIHNFGNCFLIFEIRFWLILSEYNC